MPQRTLKGINQKIVYRNERYTKGTVTTNDPLYEGSFRRLINFKVSNQNSSLENREPFITVPLYDLNNNEIKLSPNAYVFSLNEDTEHSFILDMKQELITNINNKEKVLHKLRRYNSKWEEYIYGEWKETSFYVVDGDTVNLKGQRYRLAIIDAPELEDKTYEPTSNQYSTLGEEAKSQLENFLKNGTEFKISQFDFQSEKIDQFGRPMVYITRKETIETIIGNEVIHTDLNIIINIKLLEQGFASIYGMNKFKTKERNFIIPKKIYFEDDSEYSLKFELEKAYKFSLDNKNFSPINKKYNDISITFEALEEPLYYTKPVVHKIEKETNVEFTSLHDETDPEDTIFIENKLVKRVLKTLLINELKVKEDLEIFSDQSLRYELVLREDNIKPSFNLTVSKYEDQYLNFLVKIYNEAGASIYTGLIELSRITPNPEEGIVETFNLRTYKRPEVHVEIQDQTNLKPNILDDSSIIPETLMGDIANAKGITSPKVDTVLLEVGLNSNLELPKEDDPKIFTKYLRTNRGIYSDFKSRYNITPYFKAPKIKGKKYMYRWDLISGKEINTSNKSEVDFFSPYFRSAWVDLYSGENISTNEDRIKKIALSIDSARQSTKYLVIERNIESLKNQEEQFNDEDIGNSTINYEEVSDYLYNLDNDIESFINNNSLQDIKNLLTANPDLKEEVNFNINNKDYIIRDIVNHNVIASALSGRKSTDEIGITISSLTGTSKQTYENINNLLEEIEQNRGSICFIFLPYKVKVSSKTDDEEIEEILYISTKTKTITFDLESDRKIALPLNLKVKEDLFDNEIFKNKIEKEYIINTEKTIIETRSFNMPSSFHYSGSEQWFYKNLKEVRGFVNEDEKKYYIPQKKTTSDSETKFKITLDEFFEDGFVSVFYLTTYEEVEDLTYQDVFYDQLAYKKTSAVYNFRESNAGGYAPSDFVRDRLQMEARALKYCNYIGYFDYMTVLYGNPRYRNTIFLSEPGSPYYFGLTNAFEFDAEVVHVNQFKDVLMVFTINDIWVIYWHQEKITTQDNEGKRYEETKVTLRQKKILYNISTEHKNKVTIKNLTRYVTLVSNNVLYLITPSSYIADDTQYSLKILSQNIEHLMKNPLHYINERLLYYEIKEAAKEYKLNLNASDNFVKLYYSVVVGETDIPYTLIVTYDILNNRWYEEDTISFGNPNQIYLLDSTTGYEMLTEQKDNNYLTYQTDKYKNLLLDEYGQSYYDLSPVFYKQRIRYFIDTGYLKLSEHLRKRFRQLLINIKNLDSKEILFTYNFTIDDVQYTNDFEAEYLTNNSNEIIEIEKINIKEVLEKNIKQVLNRVDNKFLEEYKFLLKYQEDFNIGFLENFLLDFSYLGSSDIMMLRHNLLGRGRLPRLKMGFSAMGRFYMLSFGIVYTEKGGK